MATQARPRRRRRGKRIPTCADCGAGILWLTSRGRRIPFDRLPVDADEAGERLAFPCYRGEAWVIDDVVLELQAVYGWDPGQARRYALEQLPWHVPHRCPTDPPTRGDQDQEAQR